MLFASGADAMHPADDDALVSWYRRERSSGALRLVGPGTRSGFAAGVADMSKDGRWVCFASLVPLVPADTDRRTDVYLADLAGAQPVYTRVTAPAAGFRNGDACALSADGSTIAYESFAQEDADDTDAETDVYVRPVPGPGTPELASRATGVAGANDALPAFNPDLDANGSVVAFATGAALGAGDGNDKSDVYVRDRVADTTEIVSTADNTDSAEGNGISSYGVLSADGRHVAFASNSGNLVPVTAAFSHVYRKDRTTDDTIVVSREPDGETPSLGSTAPRISADGGTVAFWSVAPLLPGDTDGANSDVYVWRGLDSATPQLELASKAGGEAGGAEIGDLTAAGDRVVFGSRPALHPDAEGIMGLYDRHLDTDAVNHLSAPFGHAGGPLAGTQTSGEMDAGPQAMSADGRIVLFGSDAPYLPGAAPSTEHIYARDVSTGETILISRGAGDGAPANRGAFQAAVSADGTKVAFATLSTNLGDDSSALAKVYVRDLRDGSLVLASRGVSGEPLNGETSQPVLNRDGRYLAFTTTATNAGGGDTDALGDVHRRDLATGASVLISRADGAKASGGGGMPVIDGSGNRVAFSSTAASLHGSPEVYIRDVGAGSTLLVSRADGADGAPGPGVDLTRGISEDGTRVAFASSGGLEGYAVGQNAILVRDLPSSQTLVGSAAHGGLVRPAGGTFSGGLSGNGRFVWFSGSGSAWIAEDPWSSQLTYRHDLQTGDTVLISRGPGAPGALPRFGSSSSAALSADGGCAAFDAHGIGEVATSGASGDFEHVYYRVLEGTCPRSEPVKPEPEKPQQQQPPTSTKPPVVQPPAKPPKLSDLLTAPGTRRCVSRRRLRTKLKAAARSQVAKVVVEVRGRKRLTVRGAKLRVPIDLRGLPKGRFTVTISITLEDGRVIKEKRRYRTCAPRKKKG